MKKGLLIILILFAAIIFKAYSFKITDKWLDPNYTPYIVYLDSEMNQSMMDSLATFQRISFNLDSCVLNLQTDSVSNLPYMNDGILNNSGATLLRYSNYYLLGSDTIKMDIDYYAATKLPSGIGKFHSFEITINNKTEYRWDINGGGINGGVDINTIFRHENGHTYGLDHEVSPSLVTLMSSGTVSGNNNYPVKSLGHQEILGLQALYDPPKLKIVESSTIEYGDSIVFNASGPIDYRLYSNAGFHGYLSRNSSSYNSTPHFIKCSDDFYVDTLYTFQPDSLGEYKFKIYTAMEWNPSADLSLYESNNRPYREVSFKVVAAPKIESPLPGVQYYTRPSGGKESVITDSIMIKVRVPEVLGSYPAINIKIDGTYVNQGDITFDSTEDVWVYKWDLSTVSPSEFGKMYNITTEIDGDPTDYNSVGVYLVEAVYYEDFQTITDLTAAGWSIQSYEYPPITYTGWVIANDPVAGAVNKVARTFSTYSSAFYYKAFTPVINVPAAEPGKNIKLKYRLYRNDLNPPSTHSLMKFYVCNTSNTPISSVVELYPLTVYGTWVDVVYDVTAYAGQSIKFQWWHYYSGTASCNNTYFCIDDIAVLREPDLEAPAIDFIAGNSADIDADMNLNLGFNDNSGIGSVTADYSIEDDSNSITLSPVKGTYNYTGTIPARDHICEGSITFKIKDSVGNETVSGGHSISWGTGSILTAPENIVIAQPTSTKISITWDIVDGATSYKVFSSTDPYGTFTEDTTGTFTSSRVWEKTIDGNKYFYYVIAVNTVKEGSFKITIAGEDK